MLRLRICPNCQEEIYSKEAYFCHRCGAELSPSPEAEKVPQPASSSKIKEKSRKKQVPGVVTAAAFVSLLLSLSGAGVYYLSLKNQAPSFLEPPAPQNETFLADVSFEVQNHPFSAKGLSEIVPANVDLYLESIDPEVLLPFLLLEDEWAGIEAVFSERIGLSASDAASFLEEEFAFIRQASSSAFLARARDVDFLAQKLAENEEGQGWKAKVAEGFLIISSSSDLIDKIEEAQKKLTLNLSLTSGFVEARKGLPKTGQIFFYGKKRLEFMSEDVKGDAFVVSKKDSGILITGL